MNSATSKVTLTSSKPYLLRGLLDWIVDNGLTPYIVVDTQVKGVRVPKQHVKNGQIVLNISTAATSHFEMNNSKLQFRAAFSGAIFEIIMPIRAIQAIYASENGEGMSFTADIPGGDGGDDDGGDDNLSLEVTEKSDKQLGEKQKRSHLRVLK